jgi:hypothetical protein
MKIIGTGTYDANRTTMTNSLAAALLTRPEISSNVVNLFEDNFTAFSSYLARRGFMKKGLTPGLETSDFKVIGNRKFMWALKGYPFRKGRIVVDATDANGGATAQPGVNQSVFIITLDTNFFSPNDTLELGDRRTIVQVMDEYPVEVGSGNWKYKVKLVTNVQGAWVDPTLVSADREVGFSYTAFPELSETGYEKNTFPEWHTNYMTIQRMQFSISGSAQNTVLWVEHNGQKLWFKQQEMDMLRRWAYARENQLIFGKASIDANENVLLRDLKGREIIQGDGIVAQGDSSLKFQYNNLNVKTLENIMQNLQLLSNNDGMTEVFVMGGQAFVWNFQRLMRDVFKYNPTPLFVSEGDKEKGVKVAFNSYEMGGVKLVVAWNKAMDAAWRPQEKDIYGVNLESYRGFFVSLGNTIGGDANVDLVALGNGSDDRRYVKKIIDGMSTPQGSGRREFASNSVDGYQVQILSETGLCLKNPFGFAEIYKPRG